MTPAGSMQKLHTSPEQRVAAALEKVLFYPVVGIKGLLTYEEVATAILAADPTIAADLALAEKGRAMETFQRLANEADADIDVYTDTMSITFHPVTAAYRPITAALEGTDR